MNYETPRLSFHLHLGYPSAFFHSCCSSSTLHVPIIPFMPHVSCIWKHNTFWSPKTTAKLLCCLQGITNEEATFSKKKNMWVKIKLPNRHNQRSNDTSIPVATRQWIANTTVHCVTNKNSVIEKYATLFMSTAQGQLHGGQQHKNNNETLIVSSGRQPTWRTVSSIISLFESSTFFEQLCAHPQEDNCINTTVFLTMSTRLFEKL